MSSFFKSIQRHTLLRSFVYILLGIAIVLYPNNIYKMIINLLVAYNLVMGVINLFGSIKNRNNDYNTSIGTSIFYFICALFIFLFAKPIVSLLPILLGICFIIGGAVRITQSQDLKKYVNVNSTSMLFYGIFLIGAGILLILFSFSTVLLFFRVFGILIIISGISELIGFFRYRNYDV